MREVFCSDIRAVAQLSSGFGICRTKIYLCIIHFDIKDGKIWLQQNLTDQNPAEELVEMGVPREDIVLGLQPPYKRPYTDYGVA
jgi:hypothetical protein